VDTRSTNESAESSPANDSATGATEKDSWNSGLRFEVIANLAHELRTPIQVVLGYLEILRDEFAEELSAEPRQLLERMNANVHDLARTIDNMMEFIMADANAGAMVAEELTTTSLIADISPAVEAANQSKRLQLRYELKNAPEIIRVPRRALRSILLNLILNAIKFTPSGMITIAISGNRSETLAIEVTDSGPGMSKALLEQAAQPFTQLSKASVRRFRGLGLGLAVVQRNLKALGGTLELRPAPGHGAHFIVRIPQAKRMGSVKGVTPAALRKGPLLPASPPSKGPNPPRPLRPA